MNIVISAREMRLYHDVEETLRKKLSRLSRLFDEEDSCRVTVRPAGNNFRIELSVPLKGGTIRCEQEGPDVLSAADKLIGTAENRIKKYRGKLQHYYNDSARKAAEIAAEPEEEEAPLEIVRVKKFALKPMSPEEACLQLELLGHDFYVFRNSESGDVNVVYRRVSSGYGLIEPGTDEE